MTKPSSSAEKIAGDVHSEPGMPALKPIEEKLQKALDKALYANGQPGAQKVRNFLNGTWLGAPLHVVLKDVPIGAWTVAMIFDGLDLIRERSEFALAADTSIVIGLVGAAGAAATGVTDWSDVDPPARRPGLIHGLLNVGATALFATSLVLRRRNSRTKGRISSVLGYALMSYAAHLGGQLVFKHRVGVDRTAGEIFPEEFMAVLPESQLPDNKPMRAMHKGVPILLVLAESAYLPWLRHAPTSVGRFPKANCLMTVLSVPITPPGLLWRMGVFLMGQRCIRSHAWRSER